MTTNTGGSAFPSKKRIYTAGYPTNEYAPVDGMTLRDYFAAKAMQGLISKNGHCHPNDAYEMADAMLKARG